MGRPPLTSNDALIIVAREVFLERGIRMTTAEVAARAGVSEGVLFKRFGSKVNLLRCAARSHTTSENILPLGPTEAFTEATFAEFGERVFAHLRIIVPMAIMSWAHLMEEMQEPGNGPPPPVRATAEMHNLFLKQIELGVFRAHDAGVLARMFCGTLWHTAFLEVVWPEGVGPAKADVFLKEFSNLVFHGVAAQPGAESSKK
jgi:AcrR family transcriptional regulator